MSSSFCIRSSCTRAFSAPPAESNFHTVNVAMPAPRSVMDGRVPVVPPAGVCEPGRPRASPVENEPRSRAGSSPRDEGVRRRVDHAGPVDGDQKLTGPGRLDVALAVGVAGARVAATVLGPAVRVAAGGLRLAEAAVPPPGPTPLPPPGPRREGDPVPPPGPGGGGGPAPLATPGGGGPG